MQNLKYSFDILKLLKLTMYFTLFKPYIRQVFQQITDHCGTDKNSAIFDHNILQYLITHTVKNMTFWNDLTKRTLQPGINIDWGRRPKLNPQITLNGNAKLLTIY